MTRLPTLLSRFLRLDKFKKVEQVAVSGTVAISEMVKVRAVLDYLVTAPGRKDCYDGFYAMDINKVAEMYQKWVKSLPRVRPFYAVKCNPDPVLVRLLSKLGTGFDCASKGEIRLAMDMGAVPQDIIFAHTCKKLSHIRFAQECGVSMMTFDCESELYKIKGTYPESELLLRIRPTSPNVGYNANEYKFGSPLPNCKALLMNAKTMGLNVIGVSFHVGSGFSDAQRFGDAIEMAKAVFDIGEKVGFSFRVLDIGGGFPGKEDACPFEKICDVINSALDKYFPVGCGVQIIAEPGTYFACSPYTLVTNITTVKEIKRHDLQENEWQRNPPVSFTDEGPDTGYMYYVDDGVHGSFYFNDPPDFTPIPLGDKHDTRFPSCIWGQTCYTGDFITKNGMLPKMSVGDWLYFENMGSYSRALCSGFNGFSIERHTYYYVTPKTWKRIKQDMEVFSYDVLNF